MLHETRAKLLDLNRQFYQSFARPFASTRRRIQPGVRRVLAGLDLDADWIDVGCGSGALALEWVEAFRARGCRAGSYTGLDFSPGLLEEARRGLPTLPPGLRIDFHPADLSDPGWADRVSGRVFQGALSFAVLHHIPGEDLRIVVLRRIHDLLAPGGAFIHSEWQFHHSPKLAARVLDWSAAGIDPADLEPGDTLLDWRHTLPDQADLPGLRYVHRFDAGELQRLADAAGFTILETFESDGQGGRLGLYQVWRAE